MTRIRLFFVKAVILAIILTACGGGQTTAKPTQAPTQVVESESADEHMEEEGEHMEGEEDEHMEAEAEHQEGEDDHAHAEVPHEFEDLVNPLGEDTEAIAAGESLYAVNCAACHGETGMGDGAAAAGLDPKPASLADEHMMSELTDGYLYWRISTGGAMEPFNSAMPAWGETLTEDQVWQLVSFVRSISGE